MNTERRFSFISMNLPANTFQVVSFTGEEALSKPYLFDILLVSNKPDLVMEDVVEGMAQFTIIHPTMKLQHQGIVARFEQLHSVNDHVFYKALLVPRLWALGLTRHNQVFLDKSTPEILEAVLLDPGILTRVDLEFRLTHPYPKREYVCQYNESHLDFFSRWCEREGLYYFFEQSERGEKLVITDTQISHTPLPKQPRLRFQQNQGLEYTIREEVVTRFVCEQNLAPHSVKLRDYNYRFPALSLDSGEAVVDTHGMGRVYLYGDNLKTRDEARYIAKVRAEEARARQKIYKGESLAPCLRAGNTFSLGNYFAGAGDITCLTVSVKHEGDQTAHLMAGMGRVLSDREYKSYYSNSFTAIPANVQYRPPLTTPKPRFHGTISATVDASGEGKYAQLDEHGRYKIKLPFDLSDKDEGRASHWVRMATPYGGSNQGMHFPLLKGTEVLLYFVDGDVDRPVIAATAPNFEEHTMVKDSNSAVNAIQSASGNQMVMCDQDGSEYMHLSSPFHSSSITIGKTCASGGSISMKTQGEHEELTLGGKTAMTLGTKNDMTVGVSNSVFIGAKSSFSAAADYSGSLASKVSFSYSKSVSLGWGASTDLKKSKSVTGIDSVTISGGVDGTVKTLLAGAIGAIALGAGGCMLMGIGGQFITEAFEKDGTYIEGNSDWEGLGTGVATVGAIAAVLGVSAIEGVISSYNAVAKATKTSELKLNKKGIRMSVNNLIKSSASFKAEVDALGPDSLDINKSAIEITAKGNDIKLNNLGDATIEMEGGDSITLAVDSLGSSKKLKITNDKIAMTGSGTASMKIKDSSASLSSTTDTSVSVDGNYAKLTSGSYSVQATEYGVMLTGTKVDAGPLQIDDLGFINLG